MSETVSDSDLIQQFRDAMASCGIQFSGPLIADGRIHRVDLAGRKKNSKHGWYVCHLDRPPSGAFGDYKTALQDTWTATKPSQMTDEDRAALKRRMADDRKRKDEEQRAKHEAAKVAAAAIMAAVAPAPANHPYVARKGIKPVGLKVTTADVAYLAIDEDRPNRKVRKGTLIVPIYGPDKTLWSVQMIDDKGAKFYLPGTNKAGHYYSLGKLTDIILIAEGFATAASLHEATGYCTVVAFDSGNLAPVAKVLRAKFPDKTFIIAADNDHATKSPIDNPGRHYGEFAGDAIGARVIWPEFGDDAYDGDKPRTDFNDLHVLRGLDAVRAALEPPRPSADIVDIAEARAERDSFDERQSDYEDVPEAAGLAEPMALGHASGLFYYMSARTKQVVALSPAAHTGNNFLHLAPLMHWEINFSTKKGVDWLAAAESMMAACEARGIYNPNRIAGRGVRLDDGRVVLHLGDKLVVDGKINGGRNRPSLVLDGSRMIYQLESPLELERVKPLDVAGGRELVECIGLLPWTRADMAAIFAGWLVTAPICGAMRWRPHLWLSGPAGSGKSWILDKVARRTLGPLCVSVGGTQVTEAGIRQELQKDALPILFDESESQNEKSRERLQSIMDLARQASSEDTPGIIKGSQSGKSIRYEIRSPFLFSSINMGATQSADLSRIISLTLEGPMPDEDDDVRAEREANFAYIKRRFDNLLANGFCSRLFGRTLRLVKTIRANAEMLAAAMSEVKGQRRLADTHAAPLAGWLSLTSEELLSMDAARKVVHDQSWVLDMAERNRADPDHEQALSHLMVQVLRLNPTTERSIGELIWNASESHIVHRDQSANEAEQRLLRQHGIRVDPGGTDPGTGIVYFARRHDRLSRLFERTPWAQKGWEGVIEQHPKVRRPGPVYFAPGATSRALQFDLRDIMPDRP